jgi:hypothetical protein
VTQGQAAHKDELKHCANSALINRHASSPCAGMTNHVLGLISLPGYPAL